MLRAYTHIYGQPTWISFCLHRRVSTCRVLRTHIRIFFGGTHGSRSACTGMLVRSNCLELFSFLGGVPEDYFLIAQARKVTVVWRSLARAHVPYLSATPETKSGHRPSPLPDCKPQAYPLLGNILISKYKRFAVVLSVPRAASGATHGKVREKIVHECCCAGTYGCLAVRTDLFLR